MIKLHEKALDFTLKGSDKNNHSLSDYLGKNVILYFYPKDHTPGCTLEAEKFRDEYDTYENLNAVILGVSRDSLESHDQFIKDLDLPFTLLSDPLEKVSSLYDVLKEKEKDGKKVMGIQRSTFIIDEDGILIYENRNVNPENHAKEVGDFLKNK